LEWAIPYLRSSPKKVPVFLRDRGPGLLEQNPAGYFNAIVDRRSALLSPEESLAGETLLSIESAESGQQDVDILVFLR
jgi:hypothetical protein